MMDNVIEQDFYKKGSWIKVLTKRQAELSDSKELKGKIIECWIKAVKENIGKIKLKVDWLSINLDKVRTFRNICS